jgi:hypothetical protein
MSTLKDNTSCVQKFYYQSVYCHLIQYLLIMIHTVRYFMNSCKWFWCDVIFKNEYVLLVNTPCSHLHSFCKTGTSSGLEHHGEVGRVYYMGVDLLLISSLYFSTWLFLGNVLHGKACIILSASGRTLVWLSDRRQASGSHSEIYLGPAIQRWFSVFLSLKKIMWCSTGRTHA